MKHPLTLEMRRGWCRSWPPCMRKPQGEPPSRVTSLALILSLDLPTPLSYSLFFFLFLPHTLTHCHKFVTTTPLFSFFLFFFFLNMMRWQKHSVNRNEKKKNKKKEDVTAPSNDVHNIRTEHCSGSRHTRLRNSPAAPAGIVCSAPLTPRSDKTPLPTQPLRSIDTTTGGSNPPGKCDQLIIPYASLVKSTLAFNTNTIYLLHWLYVAFTSAPPERIYKKVVSSQHVVSTLNGCDVIRGGKKKFVSLLLIVIDWFKKKNYSHLVVN